MQIDQIGKYKIVGKIGQGAMGEVYKAHDAVLNRMVAIKTITADLGSDETLRKRFQREAQSAARLNHPNIITVYDYGEEQGKIYMAMELLEGIDLKQTIVQRAPLSLDEKLEIMDQICDGLAFAHAGDIIHRDLKPANILVDGSGRAKVPPLPLDDLAAQRFLALKTWRAEVAREHNLPAYVVFHDATLAEMARGQPDSLDALAGISGVGVKKLQAYGSEILRVLQAA